MIVDYDILAGEYAQLRHVHSGVLTILLRNSRINSTSRTLEVGCGTGNYIIAIQAAVGCTCQGIDPSEQMLAAARQRSHQVQFELGRAEEIGFSDGTFDLVFSVDVIHHVSDQPAFFREAKRVLKTHGSVCTVTDSEEIIRNRQPLANYFPETVEVELKRYPRIADLRTMMARAGFKHINEIMVELHSTIDDIEAYRQKVFSSLLFIPAEAFEQGIQHMEADLRSGPIPVISRYLLLWGAR